MIERNATFDRTRVAVAFMLASVAAMVVTIAISLFAHSPLGYGACAALYAAKVAGERHFGITSPLSWSLLLVYVGLLALSMLGVDLVGYAGVIVFSALTAVVGGLMLLGRPFTSFYSDRGDRGVHWVVSWIWLATAASALLATVLLIPSVAFLFVPPVISLAGAASMLFVNFVWCGRSRERRTTFAVDDLVFKQLSPAAPEDAGLFEEFAAFYGRAIVDDPRQGAGDKSLDQVIWSVREAETALGSDSVIFVCLLQGRVVGSIRCILDRPGRPFPTEADGGFSLDPLRRRCRVMAVGRLAIAEDLRARPDVMTHLFACFTNLALQHDITHVLSAGFRHVLPSYVKLGFEFLFPKTDPRHGTRMSHGFVSFPVMLDFQQMIFQRVRSGEARDDFYGTTHKYLAERWFKRALVRSWMRAITRCREPAGIGQVRALLAPASSTPKPVHAELAR
jgi:hypothetical protein